MCGIVALISKWKNNGMMSNQQKIFDQMLLCDMVRGKDATGVIAVMKDGDFSIQKKAVDAYLFQKEYVGGEVDKKAYTKGVALIGHNRAKTIGEDSDENAHPFVEGDTFAMVHNGTLRNHKSMHDTDVDSHALTMVFKNAMDQEDWKAAMEDALGKVNGAFACIWYDQKRNQICVIRNHERPMALIETASSMVLSSEGGLAQWICSRNSETPQKATTLDTMTLYQFDMEKTGGDYSKTFLSPKYTKPAGYQNGTYSFGTQPTAGATTTNTEAPSKGGTFLERSGAGGERILLSKNAFKKLKAQIFRKEVTFWVADYVDSVNDNQGHCLTALVMGETTDTRYDLCEYNHEVRALIDLKPHGLKESDFYHSNIQMRGKIYDSVYDEANKRIVIRADQIEVMEIANETAH